MARFLTKAYFEAYLSQSTVDVEAALAALKEREWTADNFTFATAVSVMASSRIEGETLEIDSYVKHKALQIEYLPNLTERPNDLFAAYEFARDNALTKANFLHAHALATQHLLPTTQRGAIRTGNMLIVEAQTQRIQYEAASAAIVERAFSAFWEELSAALQSRPNTEETFYFAALIHLVFVKIHPFNDGNGRAARLLEKWFLAAHLGEKAWFIPSEWYYYHNLNQYYANLARVGLFYESLEYALGLPFMAMLQQSLVVK